MGAPGETHATMVKGWALATRCRQRLEQLEARPPSVGTARYAEEEAAKTLLRDLIDFFEGWMS